MAQLDCKAFAPLMNDSASKRMKTLGRFLSALLVFLLAASGILGARAAAPLELQYRLSVTRPSTNLVEVEIRAAGVTDRQIDFVMPAWAPGRYAIYDFAKNVQDFRATVGNGQPLAWRKIDKQTWRVETVAARDTIQVSYRVFGNDLTGSFSQISAAHASLSGPSIFMYVDGHKQDPLVLSVEAPQGWKLISGYSLSDSDRTFQVPNYDVLADTPLELSPAILVTQFVERGKTIRIAVHSLTEANPDITGLAAGIRKFAASQLASLPDLDLSHYTFIYHFAPGILLGDGIEHLNSTVIILRAGHPSGALPEALELGSHELFHAWNVKRLRPAGLGPFDYTREQYTNALWFAEGVTSYYSYVHLYRSGLWTRERFLDRLAREIRTLEFEPGRQTMSAESSSFHAWFYDRSPQMQETNFANTTINYYNKGAVLGLLLDLEIRKRSEGKRSLDDAFSALYGEFYDAPPETYYLPGRGYGDRDIEAAASDAAGRDLQDFFERYVRGTEPLPYETLLSAAGLRLRVVTPPDAPD